MKSLLLTILVLLNVTLTGTASDEKLSRITGILSAQVFPGRPNYESTATGDEPEQDWILTTTEEGQRQRYQLIVVADDESTLAILRRAKGKSVVVTGVIFRAETGHHHTDWLVTVRTVEGLPNH